MKRRNTWALAVLTAFALIRTHAYAAPPSLTPVIVGPPSAAQLDTMLSQPDQWQTSLGRVGAIIQAITGQNTIDDNTLSARYSKMKQRHLALELEVGAVKEWSHDGENTFRIETSIWNRLIDLGAPLVAISMDEPLVNARQHPWGSAPTADAVEQTARFVAKVRQERPDWLIGDIEPYPAVPLPDHGKWIDAVNARLRALGTKPLDFYRIDPDWAAFARKEEWHGVREIADAVHARSMAFSLIYWAATAPRDRGQGKLTEMSWSDALRDEATAFGAVGGKSDQIVVESWIGLPARALPESDPATFAGSVRRLLDKLKR